MNDWQDISTAPQNETEILVFLNGVVYQAVFEYMGGNPVSGRQWPIFRRVGIGEDNVFAPTHWKMLPLPPES